MGCFKRRDSGIRAEIEALDFLKKNGLQLIQKNFVGKRGEIDLIMQDQDDIVFIEVRYRHNNKYGSALETIDAIKQRKIIQTAHYFLHKQQLTDKVNCRFDVVAFEGTQLDWIKNAFEEVVDDE